MVVPNMSNLFFADIVAVFLGNAQQTSAVIIRYSFKKLKILLLHF